MLRIGIGMACLVAAASAMAVDQASTYPGCATREIRVDWGGAARVDLAACQEFGLGAVDKAPAHGNVAPDGDPARGYVYTHDGATPDGGGSDQFVVLDDNSDRITVHVAIAAPVSDLALEPGIVPELRAGAAMRLRLAATGGSAPYRFEVIEGAWPAGLAMDADGVVEGTPTARGPFRVTLRATGADGNKVERSLAGAVTPATMALVPARADAVQGQAFRQVLHGRGGVPPYRFTLEPGGQPPPGIALGEDGVLEGLTAAPAGDYVLKVRVSDASSGAGEHFQVATFTLRVVSGESGLKP